MEDAIASVQSGLLEGLRNADLMEEKFPNGMKVTVVQGRSSMLLWEQLAIVLGMSSETLDAAREAATVDVPKSPHILVTT